jgi:hypothetical protein
VIVTAGEPSHLGGNILGNTRGRPHRYAFPTPQAHYEAPMVARMGLDHIEPGGVQPAQDDIDRVLRMTPTADHIPTLPQC